MLNKDDEIEQIFSELTGIKFKCVVEKDGELSVINLHTDEPRAPHGFSIKIHLSWQSFEISFVPDNFAGSLVSEMGHAESRRDNFLVFASSIREGRGILTMRINGKEVDVFDQESWGNEWNLLDIKLIKFCSEINFKELSDTNFSNTIQLVSDWGKRFIYMIISLLPLEEEIVIENLDCAGLPEGAKTKVIVNKYERSPVNRETCITLYGLNCRVCGMSFGNIYGEIGRNFIHVHHIVPVSKMGDGYTIDPVKDLVPVCPNCHAMLHRKDPPYSVDELKKIMNSDNQ